MNKKIKFSLQFSALSIFILVGYQNCAPGTLNSKSMASSGGNGSFSECADGLCEVVDQKVVGVTNSQNAMLSMLEQAGVTPSQNTRTRFASQASKITETGAADTITAPMWVAITTLSSEVCNDLYNAERVQPMADRRIFNTIDFTKGYNMVSAEAKEEVIRRMARSFWARNESGQEKILIRSTVDEVFAGKTTTADTQKAAMFLCTAMMSSLKAHTY
jgi:hypothetical protein